MLHILRSIPTVHMYVPRHLLVWQGVPGENAKARVGALGRLAGEGELVYVRVGLLHQENVEVVP